MVAIGRGGIINDTDRVCLDTDLFGLRLSDSLKGLVDTIFILVNFGPFVDCEFDGVSVSSPILIAEIAAGYLRNMFAHTIYLKSTLLELDTGIVLFLLLDPFFE